MPDTKSYKVGKDIFDIPINEVEGFLKEFPKANQVESFLVDKDTFDIPINEVSGFIKEYPNAKPLKKKDISGADYPNLVKMQKDSYQENTQSEFIPSNLQLTKEEQELPVNQKTAEQIISEAPKFVYNQTPTTPEKLQDKKVGAKIIMDGKASEDVKENIINTEKELKYTLPTKEELTDLENTPEYKKQQQASRDYIDASIAINEKVEAQPKTVGEYLSTYNIAPEALMLKNDFNPNKVLSQDDLDRYNTILGIKQEIYDAKTKSEIDKGRYHGMAAMLGMNEWRSLSTGVNQGTEGVLRNLDGAVNIIYDALMPVPRVNEGILGKQVGTESVFKKMADYVKENKVDPYIDQDPTLGQKVAFQLGAMNGFFIEMAAGDKILSAINSPILTASRLPLIMGYQGAASKYSELSTKNTPTINKIKESASAFGEGVETGIVFDLIGLGAGKISSLVKNEKVSATVNLALNSGGFAGYTAGTLERPEGISDAEWNKMQSSEIIASGLLGVALGAKGLTDQIIGASFNRTLNTSNESIKKVVDMKLDAEGTKNILDKITEINGRITELKTTSGSADEIKQLEIAKEVAENTLKVNTGAKLILLDPDKAYKDIVNSDLTPEEKYKYIDKVNEIVVENSPNYIKSKPYSEKIQENLNKIEILKSNTRLDEITKEAEIKRIEDENKTHEKTIKEILGLDYTEEILTGKATSEQEIIEKPQSVSEEQWNDIEYLSDYATDLRNRNRGFGHEEVIKKLNSRIDQLGRETSLPKEPKVEGETKGVNEEITEGAKPVEPEPIIATKPEKVSENSSEVPEPVKDTKTEVIQEEKPELKSETLPTEKKEISKNSEVYKFQDKNAEEIHNKEFKGLGEVRVRIENAGDILREISKYDDGFYSLGYISEKANKLGEWLNSSGAVLQHKIFKSENQERLNEFKEAYEKQPTLTTQQAKVKELILNIVDGKIAEAKKIHKEISENLEQFAEQNKQEIELLVEKPKAEKTEPIIEPEQISKKEEAKQKISEGIQELLQSRGIIKKAVGGEAPDVLESIKKIADGVYDVTIETAKELIDKVKKEIKDRFEGEDRNYLIKLINKHSDEIARGFLLGKEPKMQETELQKQINKAVESKYTQDYNRLKQKYIDEKAYKAGEKAGELNENEKFSNFIKGVEEIVQEAKSEGELSQKEADAILKEIEKTTKFKTDEKRTEKREEAIRNIDKLISKNIVDTQKERITTKIDSFLEQKTKKGSNKQQGRSLEEWDFKTKSKILSESSVNLESKMVELETKLSTAKTPEEVGKLIEDILLHEYSQAVKDYKEIVSSFETMTLSEKKNAIEDLKSLEEYFKKTNKEFIAKSKEEAVKKAEARKVVKDNAIKGTMRESQSIRSEMINEIVSTDLSNADMLDTMINSLDKKTSEKLLKNKSKLLAMDDISFRQEIEKIAKIKLGKVHERNIENSNTTVFHPLKKWENLIGILETVFGLGNKESFKHVQSVYDKLENGARDFEEFYMKATNDINDIMHGLNKTLKLVRQDKKKELGIVIRSKSKNKLTPDKYEEHSELWELSPSQVVKIAADMRQSDIKLDYEKQYGEEGANKLQAHVESIIKNTPDLEKYLNESIAYFKKLYPIVNEVYRRLNNADMANKDGYVTAFKLDRTNEDLINEIVTNGKVNSKRNLYLNPSPINKRTGGGKIDISVDMEHAMQKYRDVMASFVGFAEGKAELVQLLTDPDVRANVKKLTDGKTYLQILDTFLNNIPNPQRLAPDYLSKMIRNIVLAPMSLNPKMLLTQGSGLFNFSTSMIYDKVWQNIPVVNQTIFMKRLLTDKGLSEYWDMYKNSAFVYTRLRKGGDRDFELFYNSRLLPTLKSNTPTKKKLNQIVKFIETDIKAGTIKIGDIAAFLGGKPVYFNQKDILRKEHPEWSEEKLKDEAFKKMANMGESTQQTSYTHKMSYFQLSSSSKYFPYMSSPIQFMQRTNKAIRDISRQKGTWNDDLRSLNELAYYSLAAPIIYQATAKFYNWLVYGKEDEEVAVQENEAKKQIGKLLEVGGTGLIQGVPLISDFVEFAGLKLQNKKAYNVEISNAISRLQEASEAATRVFNIMNKKGLTWEELDDTEKERMIKSLSKSLELSGYGVDNIRKMVYKLMGKDVNKKKTSKTKKEEVVIY